LSKKIPAAEKHDPVQKRLREIKVMLRAQAPRGHLTRLQRFALNRAVRMTFFAEQALANPATCLDDCVRVDRLAEQCRAKWQHMAELHKTESKRTPSLQELIFAQEAVR
jgi:hypothetical protein